MTKMELQSPNLVIWPGVNRVTSRVIIASIMQSRSMRLHFSGEFISAKYSICQRRCVYHTEQESDISVQPEIWLITLRSSQARYHFGEAAWHTKGRVVRSQDHLLSFFLSFWVSFRWDWRQISSKKGRETICPCSREPSTHSLTCVVLSWRHKNMIFRWLCDDSHDIVDLLTEPHLVYVDGAAVRIHGCERCVISGDDHWHLILAVSNSRSYSTKRTMVVTTLPDLGQLFQWFCLDRQSRVPRGSSLTKRIDSASRWTGNEGIPYHGSWANSFHCIRSHVSQNNVSASWSLAVQLLPSLHAWLSLPCCGSSKT
jgi:hypothetical protein